MDKEYLSIRSICMSYQVEEFIEILSNCFKKDILDINVLKSIEYEDEHENDIEQIIE